ncbi:MAG: NfeD family protein [Erysipelotrichaceae bacterium]|nr:NfeD family protein [Erysipelotrichaceae bacterium]MDY5252842.1 NfeD family protein [Erysipelotrichaceae bacterium]
MYFWLWIIIFIISLIVEFLTAVQLVSFWFAIGAIAALIANQLNASFFIQLTIFSIVSILCILMVRPLASNYLRGNIISTNADRAIGQHAALLKEITSDSWGEMKVNNVLWHCTSIDGKPIAKGAMVKVKAIEGAKLIVERI